MFAFLAYMGFLSMTYMIGRVAIVWCLWAIFGVTGGQVVGRRVFDSVRVLAFGVWLAGSSGVGCVVSGSF